VVHLSPNPSPLSLIERGREIEIKNKDSVWLVPLSGIGVCFDDNSITVQKEKAKKSEGDSF
jgi:hypothetical protein